MNLRLAVNQLLADAALLQVLSCSCNSFLMLTIIILTLNQDNACVQNHIKSTFFKSIQK